MVTIDPNQPILSTNEPNRAERRSDVKRGGFDAIFRQAVDSTKFKSAKTESEPFLGAVRPVQFSSESLPSESMLVDRVQRLIDTMGAYQQKLIDSGATLKDIQALVQKMTTQSESLSATSDTVEGQTNLKTIVDQSLTLASMEITKFNNGHYNDG
jgi:hypothetical protein